MARTRSATPIARTRSAAPTATPAATVVAPIVSKSFTDYIAIGDATVKLNRYKRQLKNFCALALESGLELNPEECKINGAYRSAFDAYCLDNKNM